MFITLLITHVICQARQSLGVRIPRLRLGTSSWLRLLIVFLVPRLRLGTHNRGSASCVHHTADHSCDMPGEAEPRVRIPRQSLGTSSWLLLLIVH
ncbi:hypothetical protein [Desulfonema magnum]|uniref:hypothetical protein n=1 Tax=Desulfonema magnum TaxID=45655 RepID=UPI001A9A787F|nr:hypothetical protein [Desulfonema magnum]